MATKADDWVYWDNKVTALRRGQLDTVNAAAAGWRTLFTALLGVFSVVTFAGGLTTIDRLASPWDVIMKVATLAAAVAALSATYLCNRAAGSISVGEQTNLDPGYLGERSLAMAQAAEGRLRQAKSWGALALAIVLLGSATVLLVGPARATPGDVVVVVDGHALCGPLSGTSTSLVVGRTPLSAGVTEISVIPTCP